VDRDDVLASFSFRGVLWVLSPAYCPVVDPNFLQEIVTFFVTTISVYV
jgi:hypothetical protein